jgi:hypothetical protein
MFHTFLEETPIFFLEITFFTTIKSESLQICLLFCDVEFANYLFSRAGVGKGGRGGGDFSTTLLLLSLGRRSKKNETESKRNKHSLVKL